MNLTPKIPNEIMRYGAPMGRKSWEDVPARTYNGRMYLQHIRLDSGGYDSGGAYWGIGTRLYGFAAEDDSINGYIRAYDRKAAKEAIRARYPLCRFFDDKQESA